MRLGLRPYHHPGDYARVSEFLIACHMPGNLDGNWLEPAWEYMHFHPAYRHLRTEMLDHAEAHLAGISRKDGRKHLCANVNDNDPDFLSLVQAHGYEHDPDGDRPMAQFVIPDPFPSIEWPDCFRLTSLAEECN